MEYMDSMVPFITCRSIYPVKTDKSENNLNVRIVDFDEQVTSPTNEVFFCLHDKNQKVNWFEEIGSPLFVEYLSLSQYEHVVFYIHGFNVEIADAFKHAEKMQAFFDNHYKKVLVVPIIWPCGTKLGIIRDYWDDQKSADMCAISLSRAINKFFSIQSHKDTGCNKKMHIIAHSMGNRVLKETMHYWFHYDSNGLIPITFENIFMKAADIVDTSLEPNQKGFIISQICRKVFIYYADDDLALKGSKVINTTGRQILTKRLGLEGPKNQLSLPDNVHSLNCTGLNNEADILLGHTYFFYPNGKPTPVMYHIGNVITGQVKSIPKSDSIFNTIGIFQKALRFLVTKII